ncbi:efflux RND transporter periplasmic adaptor subunit [Xylophilus rhododendri]|uniref:Efflux RND transporter periplasmic adaptor subunit n=1 Tax=Xylophilus rhododendri TaxID=2697032 RepID=A0A857J3I9_9BURK|nr:HlyD family secretion protein [Xylophilus rhododendri]QHI98336.1 efflux RND transporter periplasmic adaptor subunit [Xylophilus rhododendri]
MTAPASAPQRHFLTKSFLYLGRMALTLLVVLAACWAGLQLWDHYELAPWTRDGRVRANVVQIAPDVSGLVTAVPIQDNQSVKAGTLLFEVDHARYTLAERQASVNIGMLRTALAQAQREDKRNKDLGDLISQEVREQTRVRMEVAQSNLAAAQVGLDGARLNLERASVRAPSDGLITNLDLRQGSYAAAGHPVLALVDSGSIYVEGYFEETKLPRIHLGDRVRVMPMGGGQLEGTVESIAAGIADRDRSTSGNLLPSVNPSFNWVRLAQRVPVRVKLDPLPEGTRLVAGETVTVAVREAHPVQSPYGLPFLGRTKS